MNAMGSAGQGQIQAGVDQDSLLGLLLFSLNVGNCQTAFLDDLLQLLMLFLDPGFRFFRQLIRISFRIDL